MEHPVLGYHEPEALAYSASQAAEDSVHLQVKPLGATRIGQDGVEDYKVSKRQKRDRYHDAVCVDAQGPDAPSGSGEEHRAGGPEYRGRHRGGLSHEMCFHMHH
jgi:hypothetical protein